MNKRLKSCAEHEHPIQDNYVDMMEDAEIRLARGERQRLCEMCGFYRWPLDSPEAPERGTAMSDQLAIELHATTDAAVWAQRFCERFSIYTDEGVVDDKWGLMLGWFANAIEVGRSAGERAHEGDKRSETDALRVLVEAEGVCYFDHDGNCQAHWLHAPPCPVKVGRDLLAEPGDSDVSFGVQA